MNWITVIFVAILALNGTRGQEADENKLTRQNLAQRTVRLDPLLRRALLRALTDLEREAQAKIEKEEIERLRSDIKAVGKRGNDGQESAPDGSSEEIQNTADTSYPTPQPSANDQPETVTPEDEATTTESIFAATVKEAFLFHTPEPIEAISENIQETLKPEATLSPPDVESNLITDLKIRGDSSEAGNQQQERSQVASDEDKDTAQQSKSSKKDNEVELFKAPLVAAFTLHQDSKGTPHSVVPLIRPNLHEHTRQSLLRQQQQQLALLKQQEQQLLQQRQQLLQQAQQHQPFIPSVTITPLSQPNSFNQQQNFGSSSFSTGFPSSTTFSPLVSNSILPQNFQSTVVPSQSFHVSSTVAPSVSNHGFVTTPSPPRNFSPLGSTVLPSNDFNRGVSVVPSHGFSLSPTPQPIISSTINSNIQPLNIPPVTLPLQNEPRFPFPLSPPNQNQEFLDRQKRIEEQNRQRQIEEQNRQRQIAEQNRQRQIEEQNRQRQIQEYNRLRFFEEQKRQRQIEEQNNQRLIEEQNRLRQLEEERKNQFRPQRQEQGIDFQRSVGFAFNQNPKPNFSPLPLANNPFAFNIQPVQNFAPALSFQDLESRNRVNRQEAFGSTGNFGFNRPINQIPQFQKDLDQKGFQQSQFQQFSNFQHHQQYRTIPDQHYRNLQSNRFQQGNQQFQSNNIQFRPQPLPFHRPTPPVTKQLENLLIQSGVAAGDGSQQEDLNIVSKVLALNHERSDFDIQSTRVISRSERRAPDAAVGKELLVGETSEAPDVTEISPPQ